MSRYSTIASSTTRGFTGQEMLDAVCYINFNARMYDPSLGRFMSADPVTGSVYNLQLLNRYSYVDNNPLSLVDPSGLCFLGCFWKNPIFDAVLDVALAFVGLPWLEGLEPFLDVGSGVGLTAAGTAVLNAGIAGGITGYLSTGKLGGALISAGSAAAFAGLIPGGSLAGETTATQIAHLATDFVAGGLIGGLSSVAEGGEFASGFLAAGAGSLAGPLSGPGFTPEGALTSVVLGGFGSELGGGKFANGAITGAFEYAAENLAANDNENANDASNNNSRETLADRCLDFVSCEDALGPPSSQNTQMADAACLYTPSRCSDFGPPATGQEAIRRLEYMGGIAAFMGGGVFLDSLGIVPTLRVLFEGWGAYMNPEELPEIMRAPPPEPPAIIEPYNPPPPPKLPPGITNPPPNG